MVIIIAIIALPGDENGYIFSDIEKLDRLKKLPSPKIILVGGSNVAMGIDSEMLERELKMPVVNTGLHAGLGLRFLFERVREYVYEGDIVIISPEYENFFDDFYNGYGPIIAGMTASLPDHIRYLSNFQQMKLLITSVNSVLSSKIYNISLLVMKNSGDDESFKEEMIYSRNSFNQWGDVVSHLKKNSPGISPDKVYDLSSRNENNEVFHYFNDVNRYIRGKGALMIFTFPPFAESCYRRNEKSIEIIHQKIKHNSDIIIIDSPCDKNDDIYFFDNFYHLNAKGRMLRTRRLIKSLNKTIRKA